MEKKVYKNIRLFPKNCLCFFPLGAIDTENSIIDIEKCFGCGVCAESCPSGAISMVPVEMPAQQLNQQTFLTQLAFSQQQKLRKRPFLRA